MPVTVNGLIPTVKVASCICTDPSSTRFPVGSKTDKSFAPSVNSALAIIVTAVGATLNTDPATGDELTNDVANAGLAPTAPKIKEIRITATFFITASLSISPNLATTLRLSPMPTYEYICNECEHQFEAVQSFSEAAIDTCPKCKGNVRKIYNNVGVVFKGSGFYKTDSRTPATPAATPAKTESKKAPAPKTES